VTGSGAAFSSSRIEHNLLRGDGKPPIQDFTSMKVKRFALFRLDEAKPTVRVKDLNNPSMSYRCCEANYLCSWGSIPWFEVTTLGQGNPDGLPKDGWWCPGIPPQT